MPSKDGKIRVLAIAGGGIRGIIPARILKFVEERTKKPIWQSFDLICGTSTGGILSAALTKPIPLSADDCLALYLRRGKDIFPASTWRMIKTLGGNVGPKYDGQGLKDVLADTFGKGVLESALTPTFVTAYAIEKRAPIFFKSWVPLGSGTPLVDACLATSAGPTYFPPACVAGDWYWDGGVVNNNPALSGVIEACMKYGVHTKDCIVLSLGTGVDQQPIDHAKAAGWGNLQTVQPLLGVLMDGVSDLTHYQMTDLMPADQYLHLQTALTEKNAAMDSVSPQNLADLVLAAQNLLDLDQARLLAICERL
jgi:patatin-like phospholipase/acyl hydrolase